MNLHNYQEARLKSFEDKKINEVWAYPKSGGKPYPQPAGQCTTEKDFQTRDLESFQEKIESRASRAFQTIEPWSESEYEAIIQWTALHLIRNTRSRRDIFKSPENYNQRFVQEINNEVKISHHYGYVFTHDCGGGRFLITSDHPVVELWVECPLGGKDPVRCFAKSPEVLILFSARNEPPKFPIPIEDYFNAMIYALADKFIFSHRNDVSIERLRQLAEMFQMSPSLEKIGFEFA